MQLKVAGLISCAAITVECDLRQVVHTHCLCYKAVTSISRGINRHTMQHTNSAWLRATELDISAAVWGKWLGKDFTYFALSIRTGQF